MLGPESGPLSFDGLGCRVEKLRYLGVRVSGGVPIDDLTFLLVQRGEMSSDQILVTDKVGRVGAEAGVAEGVVVEFVEWVEIRRPQPIPWRMSF